MERHNQRGVALIYALLTVVVVTALGALVTLGAVHEKRLVDTERDVLQTSYLASGKAQAALDNLDTLINNYLLNTIAHTYPSTVVTRARQHANADDAIGWLLESTQRQDGHGNWIAVLHTDADNQKAQAIDTQSGQAGSLNYETYTIITAKGSPVSIPGERWEFPFSYKIESFAWSARQTQKVIICGDFTVEVKRDNFARFALFTNTQAMPNGTRVWFTDRTNFAGPVHTNDRFNFALNPSGVFEGTVSQQANTARFYNNGNSILINADANGTRDVPVFNNGFDRGVDAISLSSSTQKQDMVDQARGGQAFAHDGVYLPNNGTTLTGGIYVKGDSTIQLTVDGNNNAVYTVSQGGTTKVITVDKTTSQTTVDDVSAGSSQTYNGLPDGLDHVGTLIYVDGDINSLGGIVQADTELTIASEDDIKITNHLRYASYTPASGTPGTAGYVPPTAEGAANLLGLVSWDGDIRITTAAPDDIDIHATLLTQNGIFQVDQYDNTTRGTRGTATLLGGIISDDYGAFGQFNGSTGESISGYGRNFVYDQRNQMGNAPPYFPSLNTFIAFTNDIADKIVWMGGSQ